MWNICKIISCVLLGVSIYISPEEIYNFSNYTKARLGLIRSKVK